MFVRKRQCEGMRRMFKDSNGIGYTDFIWVSMVEIKYKILVFYSSWAQIDASQEVTRMK